MSDENRVVIVGAGPVGLAASLELARFGVASVVLERNAGTSWHPKTRNFNTRTMEIARGWGSAAYERFRGIDTPPGWKSPIRFNDTLTGREVGTIDSAAFVGPGPEVSPAEPVMSSQELIEEILLDSARATGMVDVRFETEVVGLLRGAGRSDRDVAVEVHDRDGESAIVEGLALVAADGAGSFVRRALGIDMEGARSLAHVVNCYFNAEIEPLLGDRTGVLHFVSSPRARGVLQPLDARGRWLCQINVKEPDWSAEVFTDERAVQWVRDAVGVADLDVEMRSIGFWRMNATVAERLVQGRVLLCGDAAHQFPPTGGLGVNTGLQGMHNVMWKLAWVARGWAGWPLVETYSAERRSVSARITAQSLENSANVGRISRTMHSGGSAGLTTQEVVTSAYRYGNHLGVEFGAVYESAAVLTDGTAAPRPKDDYAEYVPSATPGARLPHRWLGAEGEEISTLDLVGVGLTVIAGREAEAWMREARRIDTGPVPVGWFRLGAPGLQAAESVEAALGIEKDGAVVVRPDGHVLLRCPTAEDAPATFQEALERLTAAA